MKLMTLHWLILSVAIRISVANTDCQLFIRCMLTLIGFVYFFKLKRFVFATYSFRLNKDGHK